jgi:hypothetical protein
VRPGLGKSAGRRTERLGGQGIGGLGVVAGERADLGWHRCSVPHGARAHRAARSCTPARLVHTGAARAQGGAAVHTV